jgi:hypothetical protein
MQGVKGEVCLFSVFGFLPCVRGLEDYGGRMSNQSLLRPTWR